MHAQQEAGAISNSAFVIGDARAIGCTNFAERCVRLRHDVGDAEGTANFDQLSARDDGLSAICKRIERE